MKTFLALLACTAAALGFAHSALAQGSDMGSYWPNEDGRSWQYDQHYESFDLNPLIIDNRVRIFFDGVTVAPTGIEAQVLLEELVSGPAPIGGLVASVPNPLLRSLWLARPDLRERIQRVFEGSPCPYVGGGAALGLLLGGEFAYKKTNDEIAAWRCNLADTRSWLWLVSDLSIGNTFSLQLVPDLASNVFLHGEIAQVEDVTVPAGTFSDCLRVDYRVDYGTGTCRDDSGDVTGTFRSETHGSVHFAQDIGPVQSYEEFVTYAEATPGCAGPGAIGRVDVVTSLRLSSGPVPVQPSTWGRIKAAYR